MNNWRKFFKPKIEIDIEFGLINYEYLSCTSGIKKLPSFIFKMIKNKLSTKKVLLNLENTDMDFVVKNNINIKNCYISNYYLQDENFIEQYKDILNWRQLSSELPTNLLIKYKDYVDWKIALENNIDIYENFILDNLDKFVDCKFSNCKNIKYFSIDFLLQYSKSIDWNIIAMKRKFTEDELRKCLRYISFDTLMDTQKLSEEFIIECLDNGLIEDSINNIIKIVSMGIKLTEEFLEKYVVNKCINYNPTRHIHINNPSINVSEEFVNKYIDIFELSGAYLLNNKDANKFILDHSGLLEDSIITDIPLYEDTIHSLKDCLSWHDIASYQKMSTNFIINHKDYLREVLAENNIDLLSKIFNNLTDLIYDNFNKICDTFNFNKYDVFCNIALCSSDEFISNIIDEDNEKLATYIIENLLIVHNAEVEIDRDTIDIDEDDIECFLTKYISIKGKASDEFMNKFNHIDKDWETISISENLDYEFIKTYKNFLNPITVIVYNKNNVQELYPDIKVPKTIMYDRDIKIYDPCREGITNYLSYAKSYEEFTWDELKKRHYHKNDIAWFLNKYNKNCIPKFIIRINGIHRVEFEYGGRPIHSYDLAYMQLSNMDM